MRETMSNKGTALQLSTPSSPLRGTTFVRSSNVNGQSNRNGVKKNSREKLNEAEACGASVLNFELIGSPAPRSQVRALVSSVPKYKPKQPQNSRVREQNDQDSPMEKFYQFADNPTQFVCSENQKEKELKLDLAFSDRSGEESDNFYNSHNIAFGENGVYRIPEYDHIRYLEFNVGQTQDHESSRHDKTSTSVISEHRSSTSDESSESSSRSYNNDENPSISAPKFNTVDPLPRKDETSQWYPKNGSVNYPLGSATNYKNNFNPMVEKFMLDTGPESVIENYTPLAIPYVEESVVKSFVDTLRWRSYDASLENSSKSSPRTSQTTLASCPSSSREGTWHEHSLNSPYFATSEQSSGNLNEQTRINPETEQYLTIVREEKSSVAPEEENRSADYIFIAEELFDWECQKDEDKSTLGSVDALKSSVREGVVEADERDASETASTDYCIKDLFLSSSSQANVTSRESERRGVSFSMPGTEAADENGTNSARKTMRVVPKNHRGPNGVFMTPEELSSAADYANKLSEILTRVRDRSANGSNKGHLDRLKMVQLENTPRLITECLKSSRFQANSSL